jgi:CTP:molybdopterin cytidylyltransferase MocA
LFAASVFDELLNAPVSEGARHVVNADRTRVLEVEVPDGVILARIDTPEDYLSRFGVSPQIREGR